MAKSTRPKAAKAAAAKPRKKAARPASSATPVTEQDIRARLLQAALRQVPFEGWSHASLMAAATECGVSLAEAMEAFPAGAPDLLDAYAAWADESMAHAFEKTKNLAQMKLGQRVARAMLLRFEAIQPHQEAERLSLNFLALPPHPFLGLRLINRTVNAIWRAVGDESVDFSYYTKRLSLAGIYAATHLYWLRDSSEGHEATWRFLDQRLQNLATFTRLRRKAGQTVRDKAMFAADKLRQRAGRGSAGLGL